MTDHSELKRLAEAATPGPWKWNDHGDLTAPGLDDCSAVLRYEVYEGMWFGVYDSDESQNEANKRLIEAANPAAVLALIAENEALLKSYAEAWEKARALHSECDELIKDAERYRWLRRKAFMDVCDQTTPLCIQIPWANSGLIHSVAGLDRDAAVDEAMSKESPNG